MVAFQSARSSPVSSPAWRSPVVSMTGVRMKVSMASATKPLYQTSWAALISASRPPPAASASFSTRRYMSAMTSFLNRVPAWGTWPFFSQMSRDVGHSSSNIGLMVAMVLQMLGTRA